MSSRDLTLLLVLAGLPGCLPAQTPVTFLEPKTFGTGSGLAIAAADFNGDGNMDAVTVGGTVNVFLGNGHGSFTAEPPIGVYGNAIAAADFNGDGKPDLAIASGSGLIIMLGNGNGTFRPPHTYAGDFTTLVLADFNGDALLDIAVGNTSGQVQVFFGSASGTFQAGPITTLTTGKALAMVSADFNGDGKADLAVTGVVGSDDYVAVLFGNGNGTFQTPQTYPVIGSFEYYSLIAANFTSGGAPDLAYAANSTSIGLLINNGQGQFTAGEPVKVPIDVYLVAAADLNGDGKLDLLASDGALAEILLGQGNATFDLSGQYALLANAVAIADFNNDGVPDVASSLNTFDPLVGPVLTLMMGEGAGKFYSSQAINTGVRATGFAAGDIHGNGNLDLVVAQETPTNPYIAVLPGNGAGGFGTAATYLADEPTAVAVSDVNQDGKPDVVFLGNDCVGALLNKAKGVLLPAVYSPCFGCGYNALLADFNGDGIPDVLAYTFNGQEEAGYLAILLGNGDGTFQPQTNFAENAYRYFFAADLNNDGILDLVATFGSDGDSTYTLIGNGDGTFGEPQLLSLDYGVAAIGDFNGDGNIDIALSNGAIYLGTGDGTFTPSFIVPAPGPLAFVGDFNGDGILDLIGFDRDTGLGMVLLGQGNGNFVAQSQQFVAPSLYGVSANFSHKEYPDLALLDYTGPILILLNTTAP